MRVEKVKSKNKKKLKKFRYWMFDACDWLVRSTIHQNEKRAGKKTASPLVKPSGSLFKF